MIDDLVYRLRKRAEIRKQITTRKSVQNNEPDRIAALLEEAADEIEALKADLKYFTDPCNPSCKPSICDCYQARFAINNRKAQEK